MQWEAKYQEIMPDAVWSDTPYAGFDNYLFMWCDPATIKFINETNKECKYTVFIRRYEYFGHMQKLDWKKVDNVIMVNDELARGFETVTGIKPHVVYNGVDTDKWTYRERDKGNKIAWVGFINLKKNLPLALQILAELPHRYELHIAGSVQDSQLIPYAENILRSTNRKIHYYGHINSGDMNEWLEDKSFILNTAISEGCPNSVIEAMAKGIKPIVHNWPGSIAQFGARVFDTVKEAELDFEFGKFDPLEYRTTVEEKFGLNNYKKVRDIVYG